MTTTPAPGADRATDERALFELAYAKCDLRRNPCDGYCSLRVDDAWQGWQDRAYLAAVPASEPVKRWPAWANGYLSGTVVSDFNGPKITLRFNTTAEAEAAFDAFIAMQEGIVAQPPAVAAPAPVSGMPDLAARLNEIDRHLAKCRFTERHAARQLVYSMLHDVCGSPSPQAPDTSNPTGATK